MKTEPLIKPDAIVGSSYKKNTTLQLIEYLSAAGAVGGVIVTAITQQAIFSAAPLTLSVLLNLLNRQQLNQVTRQRAYADTTEIHRRSSAEIQGLRSEIKELSAFEGVAGMNAVKESVNTLADKILALEYQVEEGQPSSPAGSFTTGQPEFVEFQNKQLDLEQALDQIQRQLESIPPADRLNTLQTDITALQIAIAQLDPASSPTEGVDLGSIQTELEGLLVPVQNQVSELAARVDNSPITAIGASNQSENEGQIYGQMEHLRTGLNELRDSFTSQLSGMRGDLEITQDQVQTVQAQLSTVQMGSATNEGEVNLEGLNQQFEGAVAPLQVQLNALEERLNLMPVTDAGAPQVSSEQFQELKGQFEYLGDRIEQLSIDLSGVHRTMEETQGQMQGVQEQLTVVQQQVTNTPVSMEVEALQHQLQATVTPLQEQLSGLEGRFNNLPFPAPETVHSQIEQVQQLQGQFGHLKERLDKLSIRVAEDMESMPRLVEERIERRAAALQPTAAPVEEKGENLVDELDFIVAGL